MNWFKGTIAEAVAVSKQKNATFVVYVEGNDENSVKLSGYLNHPTIKEKLERDCFVAVRIEGGSEAYMQFARIYQIVPLPSIFFIGKNGTPLEIATGVIGSLSELDKKIENVLKLSGGAASASASFIASEQKKEEEQVAKPVIEEASPKENSTETPTPAVDAATAISSPEAESSQPEEVQPVAQSQPTTSTKSETAPATDEHVVLHSDAVCYKEPNYVTPIENTDPTPSSENPIEEAEPDNVQPNILSDLSPITVPTNATTSQPSSSSSPPPPPPESEDNSAANLARVEQAQKLIEERRKLKQAEDDRRERDREVNRRKDGKSTQNVQQWQKEQDFKDLKESIRRDRMEDQAARQRILEQIASDRAERANKFSAPVVAPITPAAQGSAPNVVSNMDMSRIQFRIPNGETSTQTFESADTFATVRAYVKGEVIKGTGIRDFTLATTFPKHEFVTEDDAKTLKDLGLCPNAVVLVIGKASSGPSAVVARSGGIVNIFNTIFWTLLTPIIAVFGYVRNFIIGGNGGDANARPSNTGAQKRASEEQSDANDLAKKRNLDRFRLNTDGPSTSKEAIATENAGNVRRRVGGSNVHRLSDQRKDSDDENNTWNGNSTQQQ